MKITKYYKVGREDRFARETEEASIRPSYYKKDYFPVFIKNAEDLFRLANKARGAELEFAEDKWDELLTTGRAVYGDFIFTLLKTEDVEEEDDD